MRAIKHPVSARSKKLTLSEFFFFFFFTQNRKPSTEAPFLFPLQTLFAPVFVPFFSPSTDPMHSFLTQKKQYRLGSREFWRRRMKEQFTQFYGVFRPSCIFLSVKQSLFLKTTDFLRVQLGVNIVLNDYRRIRLRVEQIFIDPRDRKLIKKFETRRYFVRELR